MSDREQEIAAFLHRHGWQDAARRRLAGDASFRKYDRLEKDGTRVVLMDAPPPQEDVRPFMRVGNHLVALGFSAPRILAADETAGLLLLEDLGDDTYTRLLARGTDEGELYRIATDALIALHRVPEKQAIPEGVRPYDMPRLLEEVSRVMAWYLPLVGAQPLTHAAVERFEKTWRDLLPLAWKAPTTLVLFDYHVDNLLLLADRPGAKACGLLDFQDAVAGPATYDLMSLLEDARRDIPPNIVADMKQRYLAHFPALSPADFSLSWAVMAAQRHARVIGTFARLKLRDNKPHYLHHMPRLWRYLDRCFEEPVLEPLRVWFNEYVPPKLRVLPS